MLDTWRGVIAGCLLVFALGGCATTGSPGGASSDGMSVQKVEQIANPCDEQVQRSEKFKRTAGSAVLAALACTAAAAVFDALKGGGNLKTSDYAKVAAACGALGAMYGYNKASDSLRRQCELYKIARKKKLDTRFELVTIKAPVKQVAGTSNMSTNTKTEDQVASVTTISGLGHFASGSEKLTPKAKAYFQQMANQYSEAEQLKSLQKTVSKSQQSAPSIKKLYPKEQAKHDGAAEADTQRVAQLKKDWSGLSLVIIGHTDDNGDPKANMRLSEKRARAVAGVFRASGISVDRIYYQGAGASFPVADNRTASGRARNRRVEIVELPSGADVSRYLSLRRPNPAFYRPISRVAAAKPTQGTAAQTAKSSGRKSKHKHGATTPSVPATAKYRKPVKVRSTGGEELDFGGVLAGVREPDLLVLMGGIKPKSARSWGFINTAVADETVYQVPCIRDDPARYDALPIKGLANDKAIADYKTGQFMPGLYNTSWVDIVNGHYLAFKGIAVTRDGRAVSTPEVLVYKDYADKTRASAGNPLRSATRVTTMEGNEGLLYRMYMDKGAVMRCVDLILPYQAPYAAKAGQMYYEQNGAVRQVDISPKKVSKQQ